MSTATTEKPQREQVWQAFFDPYSERRLPALPPKPTDDEILAYLDSAECPLNEIIVGPANKGSMEIIRRNLFAALKRYTHSMRGMSFSMYGLPGSGKNHVVRQIFKTLGGQKSSGETIQPIPLIIIQSAALADTYMLFQELVKAFEKYGTPIVPNKGTHGNCDYYLPPCGVAFDEAHKLKKSLMQGALLNPMEHDDGILICPNPAVKGGVIRVDCSEVCWVAMTTDPQKLFPAFRSRLQAIEWSPPAADEIEQIVLLHMQEEFEKREIPVAFDQPAASLVSRYCRIPRLALSFARTMAHERDMSKVSWADAAATVAENLGIDHCGLNKKQVAILTALGQRPIAKKNIALLIECDTDELESTYLPSLMRYDEGGPMVVPNSKGLMLTEKGLGELDKRGIVHKGERITAEHYESK